MSSLFYTVHISDWSDKVSVNSSLQSNGAFNETCFYQHAILMPTAQIMCPNSIATLLVNYPDLSFDMQENS